MSLYREFADASKLLFVAYHIGTLVLDPMDVLAKGKGKGFFQPQWEATPGSAFSTETSMLDEEQEEQGDEGFNDEADDGDHDEDDDHDADADELEEVCYDDGDAAAHDDHDDQEQASQPMQSQLQSIMGALEKWEVDISIAKQVHQVLSLYNLNNLSLYTISASCVSISQKILLSN